MFGDQEIVAEICVPRNLIVGTASTCSPFMMAGAWTCPSFLRSAIRPIAVWAFSDRLLCEHQTDRFSPIQHTGDLYAPTEMRPTTVISSANFMMVFVAWDNVQLKVSRVYSRELWGEAVLSVRVEERWGPRLFVRKFLIQVGVETCRLNSLLCLGWWNWMQSCNLWRAFTHTVARFVLQVKCDGYIVLCGSICSIPVLVKDSQAKTKTGSSLWFHNDAVLWVYIPLGWLSFLFCTLKEGSRRWNPTWIVHVFYHCWNRYQWCVGLHKM